MKNIKCLYTHVDQFNNKFNELQIRVNDYKPHIHVIGVTDVEPKNSRSLSKPGKYNMEWCNEYSMLSVNLQNDIGRGMIIYIHNSLKAEKITMSTQFQENIFIKVEPNSKEFIIVVLAYKSDSGTMENNSALRDLIKEAHYEKVTFVYFTLNISVI